MYFGTHSWCSVQSACSPQGQPRWCREKSQMLVVPGLKHWHCRLFLSFGLASSVLRLSGPLRLLHRQGLSMSRFLTNWPPNWDPPVFWMCKKTITLCPLMSNLWTCTLAAFVSSWKPLRSLRFCCELKIPRRCTLNDMSKSDPLAATRSTVKRALRLTPPHRKVIILTNWLIVPELLKSVAWPV